MLWYVTALLLLLPYTVLLLYYRFWWNRQHSLQVPGTFQPTTRFTVIIPARNEAANINTCLQSVLQQDYPVNLYEIIVVDDFSEDNTPALVSQHKSVKLLQLKDVVHEKINSYKKKALETGIARASGDYIVTTDADCIVPPGWLRHFAYLIEQKPAVFIAAPVAIKEENSFIKLFQSLDFMSLQGITGASVAAGFHSMCNGANLCYSRKAFYEVEGFKEVDHIASGDDLLLMHKLYRRYPAAVHYCKAAGSIVSTNPVESTGAFFRQRIRWASKAGHYQDKRITAVLVLVYLLNCFLLALLVAGFFRAEWWMLLTGCLFVKTIAELCFLRPVASFFKKEGLLTWFPLLQPFHIVYTVIAGWLGLFSSYEWKGRTVK
jgi:cellulose synthase/poly-beta-1,6-N-acetylglucosamine synthase-like glycosyltransferase